MNIVINFSDEHNDYYTLTDDNGTEYPWHGRKGIEQNPEQVLFLIRKKEYPDCPPEKKVDLETMEQWIADGCKVYPKKSCYDCSKSQMDKTYAILCPLNPSETDYDFGFNCPEHEWKIGAETIAEKVPWVSTHPEFITASGEERATMVAEAKAMIAGLSYAGVDNHIENVFGNLNTAQKASLKKLYKATLFLLRK